MKKILVCCNTGVTTSLLVSKLEAEAVRRGAEYDIQAYPLAQAIDHLAEADVVLLAPQIGFAQSNLMEATKAPVSVIDVEAYSHASAAAILDAAAELMA